MAGTAAAISAAAGALVEVAADGDGTGEASDKEDELPDPGASAVCGRGVEALRLGVEASKRRSQQLSNHFIV